METKVVHFKREKYDLYIGRPAKWSNPFTHKPEGSSPFILVESREEALELYREWITKGDGQHLLQSLNELKGKTLGCKCKPYPCHGDILIELIEKYT
jgi:hypothetical protein